MAEYLLREATRDDMAWLYELRIESMGEAMTAAGYDMSVAFQTDRITTRFDAIRIVTCGAPPVDAGMTKVSRHPDRFDLEQLQIAAASRGRGLGTALLRDLQGEATTAGVPIRLHVLRTNPAARRLYQRIGFVDEGGSDSSFHMIWRPA